MFKRIKNLWNLSGAKQELIDDAVKEIKRNAELANHPIVIVKGDGKAEFLGQGTEEEFKEQEKEDKGFRGIFGL